jgi:hypothetical protein
VSETNLERVRRFYPIEGRLDIAPLFQRDEIVGELESQFADLFHHDFETVDPSGSVTPTRGGMAGYIDGWRDLFEAFESWSVIADGFVESGDSVLVTLDIVARSATDQVDLPVRAANVLIFKDGKVARVELHTSVDAARRAAGLEGS